MKKFIKSTCVAVILSFVIALICYIFGTVLLICSGLAFNKLYPYNLLFLPLVGVITIFIKNAYKRELDQSMKKIFHATRIKRSLSFAIVPFQIIMTWLSHLTGASVGREGVALQIGATTANNFAHIFKMDKRLLTSSGKAAGFSALFGTPLAGLFFVYELNHKKITDLYFWYITIVMVYLSSFFAEFLGMQHFSRHVDTLDSISLIIIIKLLFATLIFVFVGNIFVYLLKVQKEYYKKLFKNEYIKVVILSIIYVIVMIVVGGTYMSLGVNLIEGAFDNPQIINNFDFVLKLLFTTYIISIGYQGGEVTPLFSIGATLGIVIAKILGLPLGLMAALGYSIVFASAANAYMAGFFIALEIFGFNLFPYILFMTIIAYLFKNNNGIYNHGVYKESIYKNNYLKNRLYRLVKRI